MTTPVTPVVSAEENYWRDAVSIALEESGAPALNAEQLAEVADSIESSHDNYSMAFYSPPQSERTNSLMDEATKPLKAEVERLERIVEVFTNSVKRRRGAEYVYIEGNSVMYG